MFSLKYFVASRYVLMGSLYNRLGGNVMKWSNLKGQQWGGATLPVHHDGEFFNIELKVFKDDLYCFLFLNIFPPNQFTVSNK